MKKAFFLALALLACVPASAVQDDTSFSLANARYRADKYPDAVALYEKGVGEGEGSAALWYNLGNAYFRAGRKGKAVVAYERAHRLDPRDHDVEWNKGVLKNALVDRIDDAEENVFFSSLRRLADFYTVDEAALLFVFLLACLCLVSAANFLSKKTRPLTAGAGGVLVFLLFLSAGAFYLKWLQVKDPRAVVLDREVAARYGPSEKETKAFVLHEGAEAVVTDQTADWYYVLLKNKNSGWLPKKSCEIV